MPCLVHTHTSHIEPHADAGVFFFVLLCLFLCMHTHRRLFSFVCLHVWTQANYRGCGVRASACVDASASGSISEFLTLPGGGASGSVVASDTFFHLHHWNQFVTVGEARVGSNTAAFVLGPPSGKFVPFRGGNWKLKL